MPAASMASQEDSIISRCCGSIAMASRGEIPKNTGSKSPGAARNPPRSPSMSQPRSAGTSSMASTPSATRRHRSSGVSTFPGSRQLMPTMAMGSSLSTALTGPGVPAGAADPARSEATCAASAAGVG